MKYWKKVFEDKLSYEKAREYAEKYRPYFITREEWNGVHFYNAHGE